MKNKNEKLVHAKKISTYFYGFDGLTLSEAIEELKDAEKAALEEVNSYSYKDSEFIGFKIKQIGNGTYWINAMFQETDKAYKKRLKRDEDFDKKQKQLELQKERDEYERLKKKFENA